MKKKPSVPTSDSYGDECNTDRYNDQVLVALGKKPPRELRMVETKSGGVIHRVDVHTRAIERWRRC